MVKTLKQSREALTAFLKTPEITTLTGVAADSVTDRAGSPPAPYIVVRSISQDGLVVDNGVYPGLLTGLLILVCGVSAGSDLVEKNDDLNELCERVDAAVARFKQFQLTRLNGRFEIDDKDFNTGVAYEFIYKSSAANTEETQ